MFVPWKLISDLFCAPWLIVKLFCWVLFLRVLVPLRICCWTDIILLIFCDRRFSNKTPIGCQQQQQQNRKMCTNSAYIVAIRKWIKLNSLLCQMQLLELFIKIYGCGWPSHMFLDAPPASHHINYWQGKSSLLLILHISNTFAMCLFIKFIEGHAPVPAHTRKGYWSFGIPRSAMDILCGVWCVRNLPFQFHHFNRQSTRLPH